MCGAASRRRARPATSRRPQRADVNFIKRVVAGPGDRICIRNGHVILNGKRQKEPFIAPCGGGEGCDFPKPDHDSSRSLLHDGRQPWVIRRQPVLGTSPTQVDHRRRPSPPTGRRSASGSSERAPRQAAPPAVARSGSRLFRFDRALGVRFVAGADEAGRGCLAGPLVAAAVLFDYERLTLARAALARRPERLQAAHRRRGARSCTRASCGAASAWRSPRAACAGSTSAACTRRTWPRCRTCCAAWASRAACACRDGFPVPATGFEQRPVVGGDATSAAIAAASVIAKVTRDRFMRRMEERYPGWEFARPRRLLDARAPRRDREARRLAAAPHVVPVDGLPAARALKQYYEKRAAEYDQWYEGTGLLRLARTAGVGRGPGEAGGRGRLAAARAHARRRLRHRLPDPAPRAATSPGSTRAPSMVEIASARIPEARAS